jgi:hypothetical protein
VVHFDRDRHGVDVMENVFRGVQVLTDRTQSLFDDPMDAEVRAWLAGTTISTVHVRVLEPEDR